MPVTPGIAGMVHDGADRRNAHVWPEDTLARVDNAAIGEELPKPGHVVDEAVESGHTGRSDAVSSSADVCLHLVAPLLILGDRFLHLIENLAHIILGDYTLQNAEAVHVKVSKRFCHVHVLLTEGLPSARPNDIHLGRFGQVEASIDLTTAWSCQSTKPRSRLYTVSHDTLHFGELASANLPYGRYEMGKGGKPKREARKAKKTAPSMSSISSVGIVATPEVEVIRKKRKPREEDF